MIGQIFQQTRRPVGELPEFCRLVGACGMSFPVRIRVGKHTGKVVVLDIETGKAAVFEPTKIVDALVPESWESARLDIEFSLMMRGVL
jgi:hypothetical protein